MLYIVHTSLLHTSARTLSNKLKRYLLVAFLSKITPIWFHKIFCKLQHNLFKIEKYNWTHLSSNKQINNLFPRYNLYGIASHNESEWEPMQKHFLPRIHNCASVIQFSGRNCLNNLHIPLRWIKFWLPKKYFPQYFVYKLLFKKFAHLETISLIMCYNLARFRFMYHRFSDL